MSRIFSIPQAKAWAVCLALLISACSQHASSEQSDTSNPEESENDGKGMGGDNAAPDCPIFASECPTECESIIVLELVQHDSQVCLDNTKIVGCYAPPDTVLDYKACALAPDESYVFLGDMPGDLHLINEHGYRSCREEVEPWESISLCTK